MQEPNDDSSDEEADARIVDELLNPAYSFADQLSQYERSFRKQEGFRFIGRKGLPVLNEMPPLI